MQLPQLTQEKKKTVKYEWDDVILDPPTGEQSKIVLDYLIQHHNLDLKNNERKNWHINYKPGDLLTIMEEKTSIFPTKTSSLKKIEKDINYYYGEEEKRRLRPGEEAAIVQEIEKIIDDFKNYPETIKLTITKAIDKILFMSKFTNLSEFPLCRKQVELHYRIMMTKFRCSDYYSENIKDFKRHMMAIEDKVLIDLNSESLLSEYLTKRIIKKEQFLHSGSTNGLITKTKSLTKTVNFVK